VSRFVPSCFIENKDELIELIKNNFFDNYLNIGITAGASTMYEDVCEMKNILENI
jgi:4-hydroxy-3-methylbut-2-enyl diphosphate reductase IspH